MEGVWVMDFRELRLCAVILVGSSSGGECLRGKGSVVTGWGKIGGRGENRRKSG
jgi:hypothetical protein